MVSQNQGYPVFRGPHNMDDRILGSTLGFPYFRKMPPSSYRFLVGNMGTYAYTIRIMEKNTETTTV